MFGHRPDVVHPCGREEEREVEPAGVNHLLGECWVLDEAELAKAGHRVEHAAVQGAHGRGFPFQPTHQVNEFFVLPDNGGESEVVLGQPRKDLSQVADPVAGDIWNGIDGYHPMDRKHRWIFRRRVHHEHHDPVPGSRAAPRSHLLSVGQGGLVPMVPIGDEEGLPEVPVAQRIQIGAVPLGGDPQPVTDSFLIDEFPICRSRFHTFKEDGLGLVRPGTHRVDGREVGGRGSEVRQPILHGAGHRPFVGDDLTSPRFQGYLDDQSPDPLLSRSIGEAHLVRVHGGTADGNQRPFRPPPTKDFPGVGILVVRPFIDSQVDPSDVVRAGPVIPGHVVRKDDVVRRGRDRGQVADPGRVVKESVEGGDRRHGACIEQRSKMSESVYQLLSRGSQFLAGGHPHQAVMLLERAKLAEPEKGSIHEALGRALYMTGRWARARREFAKAVAIDPVNDYAHYALGLTCARTGQRNRAIAHLKLAVAMSPRDEYRAALSRLTE